MNELARVEQPIALPRINITVRPGTLDDVPFMDALQKLHTKQVGWMPRAQFEGKIKLGHVLIAEELRVDSGELRVTDKDAEHSALNSSLSTGNSQLGYCIGNDQYFKRDDVGIIYQMNVVPGKQRGLIGATLLQAMFERSAYGCKLFCCWCAQDIAANKFWEAMGFVPLAFRSGSAKKARTHIFWQKRIRSGDTSTPWWFPAQTSSGSIREDRLVLPIPPGTHWSDAKPMILPGEVESRELGVESQTKRLPGKRERTAKGKTIPVAQEKPSRRGLMGMHFVAPAPAAPDVSTQIAEQVKVPKEKKTKPKNNPTLVAAVRELRDRYLEQVNATPLLPVGKYDVSRAIERSPVQRSPVAALPIGIAHQGLKTLPSPLAA